MKPYKLKDTTYQQIENYMECPYTRWHEINSHLVFAQYGHTAGDLAAKIESFEKAFDEGAIRDCAIFMHEAKKCAINIQDKYNAWEHIFALLVLNDEEAKDEGDKKYVEMSYLKGKIEKFRSEGLIDIQIGEVIAFFFRNSLPHLKLDSLKVLGTLVAYLATMTSLQKNLEDIDATST